MASPSISEREKIINTFIKHLDLPKIEAKEYHLAENRNNIIDKSYIKDFDIEYYSDEELPNGINSHQINLAIKQAKETEKFFGFALWRVAYNLLLDLSCKDYCEQKTMYDFNIQSSKQQEAKYINDIDSQLSKIEEDEYLKELYTNNAYIDIYQKYPNNSITFSTPPNS